jgi:hypothetical protein
MSNRDDLSLEIDLTKIDVTELEGEDYPPPGKYHAQIDDVQRVSDQTSYLKIRFLTLAGTDSSAVGRVFSERFYLSDKAVKRLKVLAYRLGLIGEGDIGTHAVVNWREAIGRQLVVEVVEGEYTKKDGSKGVRGQLAFAGFWAVDDERVKDVPKDADSLRRATAQAAARPAAAPAGANDYADL